MMEVQGTKGAERRGTQHNVGGGAVGEGFQEEIACKLGPEGYIV